MASPSVRLSSNVVILSCLSSNIFLIITDLWYPLHYYRCIPICQGFSDYEIIDSLIAIRLISNTALPARISFTISLFILPKACNYFLLVFEHILSKAHASCLITEKVLSLYPDQESQWDYEDYGN